MSDEDKDVLMQEMNMCDRANEHLTEMLNNVVELHAFYGWPKLLVVKKNLEELNHSMAVLAKAAGAQLVEAGVTLG